MKAGLNKKIFAILGLPVFFLVVFFSFAPIKANAAFGISPPFLNAVHLVPGANYSQIIYLIQDKPLEDMGIKTTITIPAKISSWITVDKGLSFTIPKGVQQYPVTITVNVPQNAELGIYNGNISFTTQPAKSGQVTIALGAQVALNLRIGNDIYENFDVPIIKPLDIEEGWDPSVLIRFDNQGNVPESFTGGTFELLDQYGAVRLAYIQKSDGFPETPPFQVKEYTVDFPMDFHIGIGQYWANVVFYQGDKVVASQKTIFNVVKAGTLNGPLAQIANYFRKNQLTILGILMLLVLAFAYIFKRRGRK